MYVPSIPVANVSVNGEWAYQSHSVWWTGKPCVCLFPFFLHSECVCLHSCSLKKEHACTWKNIYIYETYSRLSPSHVCQEVFFFFSLSPSRTHPALLWTLLCCSDIAETLQTWENSRSWHLNAAAALQGKTAFHICEVCGYLYSIDIMS